jgi:uncharacterized protein (TIGR03435 family)
MDRFTGGTANRAAPETRRAMRRFALTLSICTLFTLPAVVRAQTAPAFEVASVKPNNAGGNRIGVVAPGRLSITSATLATCIKWAFGVQDPQFAGANAAVSQRLTSERYDIVAKSADVVPESQLKLMLQTLLAERFQLVFHKQTKETQVFALVVDKSGPKFHESPGDGESHQQAKSKLARQWTWTTMPQFADLLSEAMQAPVHGVDP